MSSTEPRPKAPDSPREMGLTDDETTSARQTVEGARRRRITGRQAIGGVVAATLLAGGAYGLGKLVGGGEKTEPRSEPGVSAPISEKDRFVEFKFDPDYDASNPPAGMDRNKDGTPDNLADTDGDGLTDSDELWDQIDKKFVDPREGDDEEALKNASPEDLASISEIEQTFPDFGESVNPHWRADFVKLDQIVKDRVMYALHHPESYSDGDGLTAEEAWRGDVLYQMTRTAEEITN